MTYELMTHEPWCEWYQDDEYEYCNCGYREDLAFEEGDPKYAGNNPGEEYGSIYVNTPYGRKRIK